MSVLFAIVVLAAAVAVRALTLSAPKLHARVVLAPTAVIPGSKLPLAWPATGESAVEVTGVGTPESSGPTSPVPIASLAKVMTAYVVLQDHPLPPGGDGFNVTINAADVNDYQQRLARAESVLPVSAGEQLSELELLQGLLVASGNNVGRILADYDAGSVGAFVTKMNATAQQLGMARTTYTDPSGLDAKTVSDASDQLILAAKAIADPVFARTVNMRAVDLPVAGTVTNFNRAVGTGGYVGIKTGSDASAGGCLMFANRQRAAGRAITILGVVLGQGAGQESTTDLVGAALNASTTLVHSVVASIGLHTVVPAGTVVADVTGSHGPPVTVVTASGLSVLGFPGMRVPVTVTLERLGTTLSRGETVATVALTGAHTRATAAASLSGVTLTWRLRHLL